jgi:hypothetical protein
MLVSIPNRQELRQAASLAVDQLHSGKLAGAGSPAEDPAVTAAAALRVAGEVLALARDALAQVAFYTL